ncbi:hypothetical protein ES703_23181 [subsurface metagenome]
MQKIDLSGRWVLEQKNKGHGIPVNIPGDNFSALIEAGRIPDPYFGSNETEIQWVGKADWIFKRSFTVTGEFLKNSSVFLNCRSLDTCAEILINGKSVGTSCNMFYRYRTEVRDYLKEGENEIRIVFTSAERAAEEYNKKLAYPIPHTVHPVQSFHRNLIRKVQCHSGWDWGPCIMASGIYGKIFLASCSLGRIEHVHTNQAQKGSDWEIEVVTEIFSNTAVNTEVEVELADITVRTPAELKKGYNRISTNITMKDPELWWPAGYGGQPLYDLTVKAVDEEVRKRIGFRRLEVITEQDRIGRSMSIRVNGKDIFCKGANWIPMDALPALQTAERCEKLLADAVSANMNMIRVWGGGQYESEDFYRICDEKGLLVWQDFMFACSMYPAARDFLDNVEKEAVYQVKRLKDHPGIALWCGNNENIGALDWFAESRANRARYLIDYDRLNEGVLGRVVKELDPGRTWWPSSPSAGEGDYSDNWHDDTKGDMHYWSVWHEGKPFKAYYEVAPRFCSEFGYQSFPSLESVKAYAPEDQWNITSPVMEHHQKNERGNTIITENITRYFRFPEGFENFLYLSQVQQALAMKTAVEYWRSRRPICMGALYWQLNDNWPVASWSSIEYSGKWKLLHYSAKRFFQPVQLAAFIKDNMLEVWGLNDTETSYSGTLSTEFLDFKGTAHVKEECPCTLEPEASTLLWKSDLHKIALNRESCFFTAGFYTEELHLENDTFLTEPKRCSLGPAQVHMDIKEAGGDFTVFLSTDCPAFYVSLDPGNIPGVFSDNCFTLLPGKTKRIVFYPQKKTSNEALSRELKLFHLRKTYN